MPNTVTVSPRYRIVIPQAIREELGLRPGQQFQVIAYEGRIALIPVRPVREMRGFLAGLDTHAPTEPEREVRS